MTLDKNDALLSDLVEHLNKNFKHETDKTAYFLSDENNTTEVTDWVPTGLDTLDVAISNRRGGGWPVGRISELSGLEGSGKSLFASYALRNTQKKGGIAILIDTERSADLNYMRTIGVDVDRLILIPLETLEDAFKAMHLAITDIRAKDPDIPITIVLDSVMGASTKNEIEDGEYGKDGWNTDKSIVIGKAMRKLTNVIAQNKVCAIFTNQLRVRLGVTFGDPWSTSGGKAIPFHASVRVRLKSLGRINVTENGVKQIVGIKTRATITKNRLGPGLRSVEYDIYFKSGMDNYGSWLNVLQEHKLVKSGSWWKLPLLYVSTKKTDKEGNPLTVEFKGDITNPETGEVKAIEGEFKFRSKDFANWMEVNPEFREFVYDMILDRFIMKYKLNKDFGIDDIEIEEEDPDIKEMKEKAKTKSK